MIVVPIAVAAVPQSKQADDAHAGDSDAAAKDAGCMTKLMKPMKRSWQRFVAPTLIMAALVQAWVLRATKGMQGLDIVSDRWKKGGKKGHRHHSR